MTNPEHPFDYLVVHRGNGEAADKLRTLGRFLSEIGFAVDYRTKDQPLPEIAASDETSPDPVHATQADFRRIGLRHKKTEVDIGRAWSSLRREFVHAHAAGRTALVNFVVHPPVDEQWGTAPYIDGLDVYSLDKLVRPAMERVRGKAAGTANRILRTYLPDNVGFRTLEFWSFVTKEMLPQPPVQETPAL